jgi:hypothetical protein
MGPALSELGQNGASGGQGLYRGAGEVEGMKVNPFEGTTKCGVAGVSQATEVGASDW